MNLEGFGFEVAELDDLQKLKDMMQYLLSKKLSFARREVKAVESCRPKNLYLIIQNLCQKTGGLSSLACLKTRHSLLSTGNSSTSTQTSAKCSESSDQSFSTKSRKPNLYHAVMVQLNDSDEQFKIDTKEIIIQFNENAFWSALRESFALLHALVHCLLSVLKWKLIFLTIQSAGSRSDQSKQKNTRSWKEFSLDSSLF